MEYRIDIKVGETYRLELGGLGSAGYTWEYTIDDPQIIDISTEMIGDIPKLPPGGHSPNSFDRNYLFNITALHPGIAHMNLFLRRSWERDIPPLKELYYTISISK